ncbi:hypothetical protein Q1695_008134 [Nippostrongylus brasiliensis]|nr:hypothetical protein Q1695_008134 [Nippostrongylus brasiliensis]
MHRIWRSGGDFWEDFIAARRVRGIRRSDVNCNSDGNPSGSSRVKVCVHCKCDKTEHELPPNQAGSVYERLGIKPPANMPISSTRDDAPGSVSHGYAWVPPGLTRKKVR